MSIKPSTLFFGDFHVCSLLRKAFGINKKASGFSDIAKLRYKLRTFYFQGDFDMHPFLGLDPETIPSVLEFVTLSEECFNKRVSENITQEARKGALGGIYCFIHNWNLPVLLGFHFPEAENQKLKAEICVLKMQMQQIEAANWNLKSENEKLLSELKELRLKNSCLPNKR